MTQELANKLIAHYEDVIEKVKGMGDILPIKQLLGKTETDFGICWCALMIFNTSTREDKWMAAWGKGYWYKNPIRCTTKPEAIEALQFRVDRLKTFKA